MNAAQILARALFDRGVRHAFGMPGGEVLPLLEAFRSVGIEFVLVRDEASAGFMADAAWQLTGAPGVCVATLGPGALRMVSGVGGALLDRAPLVAITGQVAAHLTTLYTHQTLDQLSLYRPLVRQGITLSAREAWREIPLALRRLMDGRPAPIHLNLPTDVATAEQPGFFEDHFEASTSLPDANALAAATAALAAARQPVVLVGPADRSEACASALRRVVASLGAPALTTYRAKGLLDETDPHFAGAFGLSPVVDAHQRALLAGADLLLLVGFDAVELRPDWLPGWPAHLPLVVLDCAAPTDLLAPAAHLLIGPVPAMLNALHAGLGAPRRTWDPAVIAAHRAALAAPFDDGEQGPATAIRAVQAALPEDAIVALDVGAHRITASHTWVSRHPGRLLQSNGLSSMGFGLPAALAAALIRSEVPAVCITGDMGLWMTLGELGVAQERRLSLIVVYLADESLSLIALKQTRSGLPSVGVRFENPQVGPLASAFGGVGVVAEGPEAITSAVREAQRRGGLTLICAPIDARAYHRQM